VTNEIPLWVAVVIGLGPSVVAVFAIVGANKRDRRRLAFERESWLKDKRIEAYRKMLAATTKAHTERDAVDALFVAYVEISLIASTDEIDRAADEVLVRFAETQRYSYRETQDAEASMGFSPALLEAHKARDRFLARAREEIGIKGRTAAFRALEGASPEEEIPGPETPSSGR
jgi:hypothetical protein